MWRHWQQYGSEAKGKPEKNNQEGGNEREEEKRVQENHPQEAWSEREEELRGEKEKIFKQL